MEFDFDWTTVKIQTNTYTTYFLALPVILNVLNISHSFFFKVINTYFQENIFFCLGSWHGTGRTIKSWLTLILKKICFLKTYLRFISRHDLCDRGSKPCDNAIFVKCRESISLYGMVVSSHVQPFIFKTDCESAFPNTVWIWIIIFNVHPNSYITIVPTCYYVPENSLIQTKTELNILECSTEQ